MFMATLAIVTLPLSGHLRPMLAACAALKRAGHRPVIVGPVDLIARIPAPFETQTIGISDLPAGALNALCDCLSRMKSLQDVRDMFKVVARLSQFYLDHLPQAVDALGAEAILHDQLEPAAGLIARGLSRTYGLRHISLACALPMNREASVPPPLMGWRYRPGAFGDWLNAGYYRVVNALMQEQGRVLSAAAARFGLTKPDGLQDWQQVWSVDDGISRQLDVAQGLASLDFPRQNPPVYLGPFRDERDPFPGLDNIAGERDGRPLAFISLGTLMGGRVKSLRAMSRAAISRGFQPVIVHGGRPRPDVEGFPKGMIIRDFLNQSEILSNAGAAILHGGYNSATDAVAAGVPLVVVPQAFEQGAMAARIGRGGLGRAVSRYGPSLSQRIDLALGDMTQSSAFRLISRQAQYEALSAPGVDGFVAAIDVLLEAKGLPQDNQIRPVPAHPASPRPAGLVHLAE